MADLRLPYANAEAAGLLPDLAPIRANLNHAIYALRNELILNNPVLTPPYRDHLNLTAAQRAIEAAWIIYSDCPEWGELSYIFDPFISSKLSPRDQSWILWAAHEIDLGRTRECLDAYARMYLLDPDAMRAAYLADPAAAQRKMKLQTFTWFPGFRIQRNLDTSDHYECCEWWQSDEARLEFNRRVLEFAQRRLNELIVIDEQS